MNRGDNQNTPAHMKRYALKYYKITKTGRLRARLYDWVGKGMIQ